MQQIYTRTLMPKCDFNKVAKQRYWNHTLTRVFRILMITYLSEKHENMLMYHVVIVIRSAFNNGNKDYPQILAEKI